ncbi:1-acyl-sn-glycerol-3-phosphate acyltransferase [Candidatus Woesearchaeota archaeon]|nr:1-acyl-sn-glycerol-3-phosphate acyltransferase [Candidatus Woesearchaeota archaeon]
MKLILWPLRIFIKRIDGLENLPKGRCIIAANHASYIDPVLLMMILNQKLRFLVTKDPRFNSWWWNFWFNYFGAIRVNGSVEKAVKAAKKDCIGIFPEGGRTPNGVIQPAKHTGLGVIALETKLPVVPVGTNTFWFWSRHNKWPSFRRCIKVSIGKPMKFRMKLTKQNAKKVVNLVMKEVKKEADKCAI